MTKIFGASVAALAIATASAVAQSPTARPSTTGAMNSTIGRTPMNSSSLSFQPAITSNQVLASKLMDATVYGTDGNSIGSINDVVFDSSGRLEAVVIGVGGFLGVGEKTVAVQYQALQIEHSADAANSKDWNRRNKIVLAATREQLKDAPDFDVTRVGAAMPDAQSNPQANVPGGIPSSSGTGSQDYAP